MGRPTAGPSRGVLDLAFRKAQDADRWKLVTFEWYNGRPSWRVPSATVAGQWYRVVRVRKDRFSRWWLTLQCGCPAETINSRAVCWHKAAVVYRYTMLAQGWRPDR